MANWPAKWLVSFLTCNLCYRFSYEPDSSVRLIAKPVTESLMETLSAVEISSSIPMVGQNDDQMSHLLFAPLAPSVLFPPNLANCLGTSWSPLKKWQDLGQTTLTCILTCQIGTMLLWEIRQTLDPVVVHPTDTSSSFYWIYRKTLLWDAAEKLKVCAAPYPYILPATWVRVQLYKVFTSTTLWTVLRSQVCLGEDAQDIRIQVHNTCQTWDLRVETVKVACLLLWSEAGCEPGHGSV